MADNSEQVAEVQAKQIDVLFLAPLEDGGGRAGCLRGGATDVRGRPTDAEESAVEIRHRFEDNRGLAPGSDELARALEDAREAAFFISHGTVQATRGPSGSFS
jgi:hypothetical protein